MVGVYLLAALLFSHPGLVTEGFQAHHSDFARPTTVTDHFELRATFSKVTGLRVGAPVFLQGKQVGKVTKVKVNGGAKGGAVKSPVESLSAFDVSLQIESGYQDRVKAGTIALISAPVVSKKVTPIAGVELLVPRSANRSLPKGGLLKGFWSYEEFWSSGLRRNT